MSWQDAVHSAPSDIINKAIQFCISTECDDCPIYINDINHRTQYEKDVMHVPCVDNLIFELFVNKRTLD